MLYHRDKDLGTVVIENETWDATFFEAFVFAQKNTVPIYSVSTFQTDTIKSVIIHLCK